MRNERDMFELIAGVARDDERIRAVYMNGSRTNPNAPRDIFQDYDIVYVVTETASFLADEGWTAVFGELIMMQEPDKMDMGLGIERDVDRSYAYLMLFADGNRIDLTIRTVADMLDGYETDLLTVPLLDKDGILPAIPAPTDSGYFVRKPTEPQYDSNTNEFWWCLQNVAKGIWRDELPYARQMFESTSRKMLDEMIGWWIGTRTEFEVSPGKLGKYFKRYLPEAYWRLYEDSFPDSDYGRFWESIGTACDLFRRLGVEVAAHCGFVYPHEDDAKMSAYLERVRHLPRDAKEIC